MEKLVLVVFGPLAFSAALLMIATMIRRAVTRWRLRLSPEEMEAKREAYRNRLLNPQARAVEAELGKRLPEALLDLYADRGAIQAGGFNITKPNDKGSRTAQWPLYCFEPLDVEALNEMPYEDELGPGFCFATTGNRSWYWVAASDDRVKDAPVIFLDYDACRRHGERVADSLHEFLSWPRTPMT